MVKKILAAFGILLVLILVISLVRAMTVSSRQVRGDGAFPVTINGERAIRNLSRALTFRTIARREPEAINPSEFIALHRFLEKAYPLMSKNLTREKINGLNLLYTWKGSDPSRKPILFMAHMDVVPAEQATLAKWTHPPFSGHYDGTWIWGRGALDMKSTLIGIMEAVEHLLERGYRPGRTIYIALGCYEEVG